MTRWRVTNPRLVATAAGLVLVFAAGTADAGVSRPLLPKRTTVRRSTVPTLHVLAVGIDKYRFKDNPVQFKFAAKDAKSVAAQLEAQKGNTFPKVEVRFLLDEKATFANLRTAFQE